MSVSRRVAALFAVTALVTVMVFVIDRSGPSRFRPGESALANGSQSRARAPSSATGASSVTTTVATVPNGPPWSVRRTTLNLYDPSRMSRARGAEPAHSGRALPTTLRWPISQNGQVAAGRLPLLVFAHGFNLSAATYAAMLDDLTRAGIVVAAPEFPGESNSVAGPPIQWDLVNEPCDIQFVAASLKRDPPTPLRRVLRDAPLIVAGHSDGATAAARAGYTSTCASVPIHGVVAMAADDVQITRAFRFRRPPLLLAMTGTADEISPPGHTRALYQHAPTPAWLVTIDGGGHLSTFTTDPDLKRIDAMIANFVFMAAYSDSAARARFVNAAGGRIHLYSR